MIPINKGAPPEVLLGRGVTATERLKERFELNQTLPEGERQKLTFASDIYGHETVRARLNETHHGKCAFCEATIPRPYADAHVEHWRPKGSVRQARADAAVAPGYYWLAYDWDNLLLACLFCNRDNKSTIFPLEDPAARALNHNHDLAGEVPLLLKPDDGSDPRDHIEFVEELPKPRNGSVRGETTIRVLGLDRLEHKQRDDLLAELQDTRDLVIKYHDDPHPLAQQLVAQSRAFYEEAPKPSSPFSAMADAFIQANPLPDPA